jgi:hypothetical protein
MEDIFISNRHIVEESILPQEAVERRGISSIRGRTSDRYLLSGGHSKDRYSSKKAAQNVGIHHFRRLDR